MIVYCKCIARWLFRNNNLCRFEAIVPILYLYTEQFYYDIISLEMKHAWLFINARLFCDIIVCCNCLNDQKNVRTYRAWDACI